MQISDYFASVKYSFDRNSEWLILLDYFDNFILDVMTVSKVSKV